MSPLCEEDLVSIEGVVHRVIAVQELRPSARTKDQTPVRKITLELSGGQTENRLLHLEGGRFIDFRWDPPVIPTEVS